ncbi:MAG: baseplate J/gp47 family protein [Leptothrix sp. (in: b-proteobacteria)]
MNLVRATTNKITDFNRGSVVRTMLEATAAELEELYLQMYVGIKEAIPVSVFRTFGFEALAAESSSGTVRFGTGGALATAPIIIPPGTVVRVPGTSQTYVTGSNAAVLAIGNSYVDLLVTAQVPGIVGNTGAGTITELVTSVSGISSVTNPAPFVNGRDPETDDARKTRFQGYIASLARGTKAAVEYGAKTATVVDAQGTIVEYVAHAGVVEPWLTDTTQPISLVRVYVHNGASATSPALVARTQSVIDGYYEGDVAVPGWKAAGVQCIVQAAADQPVNVTGVLTLAVGFESQSVIDECTNAIKSHIQLLGVGASVRLSELVAIIRRDVTGVFNVALSVPTTDVAVPGNTKAIPGTITLTVAP